MPPSDPSLRAWWPTTQSLDLVEAPVEQAALAIETEFRRFPGEQPVTTAWRTFSDLGAAFNSAPNFEPGVSFIIALPTRSRWTVLWNNSFLCYGHDSLCWCLTTNHRLTTIHWAAHDAWTTMQSGATFRHRRHDGSALVERHVQAAQTDSKWNFYAEGTPLPEEDVEGYAATRKRDRFNEARVLALLDRLGARPWSEDFYALAEQPAFVISRPPPPKAVTRDRNEVLKPA